MQTMSYMPMPTTMMMSPFNFGAHGFSGGFTTGNHSHTYNDHNHNHGWQHYPSNHNVAGRWRLDMLNAPIDIDHDGHADFVELYTDGTAKLKSVGDDNLPGTADDQELDAEMYADELDMLPHWLQSSLGLEGDDDHDYDHGDHHLHIHYHFHNHGCSQFDHHGYGHGMGGYQGGGTSMMSSLFNSVVGSGGGMMNSIFSNRRGIDYDIYSWPNRSVVDHGHHHGSHHFFGYSPMPHMGFGMPMGMGW